MAKQNEVTHIKVPVNRPNRRSIYLCDEYAFSISEGIFLASPIKVGDILTDDQIETYRNSEIRNRIRDAALRLLGYRQRSIRELTTRLQQKGWELDEIQPVIRELKEKSYLNDREFARALAREKAKLKCLGPIALRDSLMKFGIERETIQEVLSEVYREYPVGTLISAILRKKGIDPERLVDPKRKKRIVNYLKQKGFSWTDIEAALSSQKAIE